MSDIIKFTFAVLSVVCLIILGPLLIIWSVNTLFPVADIKYTFGTWCAVLLLGAFLRANVTVKK
jgi:hypothetical protein